MGTDIHMYLEYYSKSDKTDKYIRNFGDRFNPGKDYVMFGVLAGVRYEIPGYFKPKGRLPFEELGYDTKDDAYMYISDSGSDETTTMECALEWEKNCGCEIINGRDGKPAWVQHPDWHSHSWMTLKEYAKAIKIYEKHEYAGGCVEYRALLAAMKSIEKSGEFTTRLVFWFDN